MTIEQTTHAGTQGLVNARNAEEVITGSFVNAGAIANYIWRRQPEVLSLVCMGFEGKTKAEEDTLCAEYIKQLLDNKPVEFQKIKRRLRNCTSSARFFDPKQLHSPESDFDLCLNLDRFDFILCARPSENGYLCLNKVTLKGFDTQEINQ